MTLWSDAMVRPDAANSGPGHAGRAQVPAQHRSLPRRYAGRMLKRALAWRYRHFRPGGQPARFRRVGGVRLLVLRGVFDPTVHFTSAFLARYLGRPGVLSAESRVLDLGTGSGLLAIAAARAGARSVVATDVNPEAVRCALANVRHCSLQSRVSVVEGDLFAPVVGSLFDVIVCNPPYFRGAAGTPAEKAYYAGHEYEWLDRFAEEAAHHLAPGGRVLVVLGDAADLPAVLDHLARPGWCAREVARKDIWIETLYIFELTPLSTARGVEAAPDA